MMRKLFKQRRTMGQYFIGSLVVTLLVAAHINNTVPKGMDFNMSQKIFICMILMNLLVSTVNVLNINRIIQVASQERKKMFIRKPIDETKVA